MQPAPLVDVRRCSADTAEYLSLVAPSRDRSFKDGLLRAIEGPWSPNPEDRPPTRSPELSGNAPTPFRQRPTSLAAEKLRDERLAAIRKSGRRYRISEWSSVYTFDSYVPNLPAALDGVKILHLSDIHFLRRNDLAYLEMSHLERWLSKHHGSFDLCFVTGDVITKNPDDFGSGERGILRSVCERAAHSFFVPGNHDYYGHGIREVTQSIEDGRISNLNNRSARITIGGAPLNLFGVDDSHVGIPLAPLTVPANETNIVLTHNLEAIRGNFPPAIDLIFSGHTHWGEFRWLNGTKLMKWWGYCENKNGHVREWDMLTDRTASFVHPGLARYYVPWAGLRHPPGFVIHTLRTQVMSRGVLSGEV
jgi:predicted MPP superfamily phosphohydrolase